MVKIFFDFLQFLLTSAPLITSLTVFTLLSIWNAAFIKRHSRLCYLIASIPFFLVAVPTVLRWCGVATAGFTGVPVLGQILRDYIHMGTLGHPLLIIVMYMGALDPKIPFVKRLMSIRKELSIMVGFPVLTHSLVRVAGNLGGSIRFFTDNEGYLASTPIASELGAGISSFSFVLGVFILAIFLPLWITSFPSVQRRMGVAKWKKLQRLSYVFYAAMFIHAVGIQVGGIMNSRGGGVPRPSAEMTAPVTTQPTVSGTIDRQGSGTATTAERRENNGQAQAEMAVRSGERDAQAQVAPARGGGQNVQAGASPRGRVMPKGFADFQVPAKTRQYIHLVSLILIYSSYLCFRVRKASKRR